MKTSILFTVGAFGALAAAVVLASPMNTGTEGTSAKAPNRAEVFLAASCGEIAFGTEVHPASWNNALASKRAVDRDLVLANGKSAEGCIPAEQ